MALAVSPPHGQGSTPQLVSPQGPNPFKNEHTIQLKHAEPHEYSFSHISLSHLLAQLEQVLDLLELRARGAVVLVVLEHLRQVPLGQVQVVQQQVRSAAQHERRRVAGLRLQHLPGQRGLWSIRV